MRCDAALIPPHCLACSSQQMFAELKSIKNNLGKHSATFFFLWNCSLPECSRTASLHCNPSLLGKNQLSHIRAGFSWDKLPGTRPDTSAEGSLFSTPPQTFSNSLSSSRSQPPMKETMYHHTIIRQGQGLLEKPTQAGDSQYMQHFTPQGSLDLIQLPKWVEQLVQSHFCYLEKLVLKSNTFHSHGFKTKKYKQLILSPIPSS